MAILTPHQSQTGIATATAGQAAPYRSASAFMTPGQAGLPSGLNQLARRAGLGAALPLPRNALPRNAAAH